MQALLTEQFLDFGTFYKKLFLRHKWSTDIHKDGLYWQYMVATRCPYAKE